MECAEFLLARCEGGVSARTYENARAKKKKRQKFLVQDTRNV